MRVSRRRLLLAALVLLAGAALLWWFVPRTGQGPAPPTAHHDDRDRDAAPTAPPPRFAGDPGPAPPALSATQIEAALRAQTAGRLVVLQCLLDHERLTPIGIWPKAVKYHRPETSIQQAQPYRYELLDERGEVVFSRGVVLAAYCPDFRAHGDADHLLGGHQLVAHSLPFLVEFPHDPAARVLRLRRLNAQGEVEVIGEIALRG